MKTKKRMLYSRKELLDLKTKSLKKLQEGKLTKKQQVNIPELLLHLFVHFVQPVEVSHIVTGKQIGRAHV